jgi:hypothetical protein
MSSMGGRGLKPTKADNNDGRETWSIGKGQRISQDFGKDHSSVSGPNERMTSMGGGVDNLSHSLNGASAHKGANKGGRMVPDK